MALRASYFGIKRNVKDEMEKLDGAKLCKSYGAGLNYNSTTGALSCKSATASQAGIAKSTDYLASSIEYDDIVPSYDADTGAIVKLSVDTTNAVTEDVVNPVQSGAVFSAIQNVANIISIESKAVTSSSGANFTLPSPGDGMSIILTVGASNDRTGMYLLRNNTANRSLWAIKAQTDVTITVTAATGEIAVTSTANAVVTIINLKLS